MTTQDQHAHSEKRRYESLPVALERDLLIAIAAHRRDYGNRHYHLIRDRAEFAPWVGSETGETGRKRFNRLVKKVGRPVKDGTGNRRKFEVAPDSGAMEKGARAPGPAVLTPDQVMAGGGIALAGWSELTELLREGPHDIELVRRAAFAPDPEGRGDILLNPELLLKANKALRAWVEGISKLSASYTSLFREREFAERLVELMTTQLADDPPRLSAMLEGLNHLIGDMGGMPATSVRKL
ncbi:MAG: hypothetical protein KKE02_17940 [Alphaproteobacteria bacterium]|nr:hypothetical protein [Alphaproteobacteria bacterium]MBU1515181.1 hypothetical protein [Alphaproteobacteria bacterium]MBU2092311.1 hypothetical protein [Alphaproteobacteria bacterium]MBU2152905.1 hypothetical protein [Alphaproteobacteria bacterium]MBU2305736.1 hypothetical protein [Alphaproteobacteria bacterium]